MFTVYHAVAFVAIFVFGSFIGYSVGHADGWSKAVNKYFRDCNNREVAQ